MLCQLELELVFDLLNDQIDRGSHFELKRHAKIDYFSNFGRAELCVFGLLFGDEHFCQNSPFTTRKRGLQVRQFE